MPPTIRPHRRFPVYCPATYHAGLSEGHGVVWTLSLSGWRLFGDLPLHGGKTCSLTIGLPDCRIDGVSSWVLGLSVVEESYLHGLVFRRPVNIHNEEEQGKWRVTTGGSGNFPTQSPGDDDEAWVCDDHAGRWVRLGRATDSGRNHRQLNFFATSSLGTLSKR